MNKNMIDKKIVIITGCNGQLGRSLTESLINESFFVFGIDLEIEESYFKTFKNFKPFLLDITKPSSIQTFFQDIAEYKDNVFGLVNNAGVAVFTPFNKRTIDDLNKVINVNMIGTILMTKEFMSFTSIEKNIRVINLGSIYGEVAPDLSVYGDTPRMSSEIYGMTKAAIINFTKYLTQFFKDRDANFNCVSPGGIEFNQGKEFKRLYSKRVPLGRMADVTEIANVISFLLKDESSYINGENIFIDGGLTKW